MNRLATSTSPYLLQHRDNPVDWWPWCDEAFAEAERTGRPVLLSIGYAACHWCHVMAHESFENESTAALMNLLFICIKVDREERPDIDHIYMSALHTLGEQGGWPLTMFLDHARKPFWGGTYFPPEDRYGRPGFRRILTEIARLYADEPTRIAGNAAAIGQALARSKPAPQAEGFGLETLDGIAARLADRIDAVNGGLSGAPKFPNVPLLLLLWRASDRTGKPLYREIVRNTLDRMVRGGIFDQIGGGFARYSVDAEWLVPHFEKMLYDNAQLLEILGVVWAETQDPLLMDAACRTVDWLSREMTVKGGAFAASLDADSEGVEGRFYVWTLAELISCLDPHDAELFARHYDISAEGNWESHAIPNRLATPDPDEETMAALSAIRSKLLAIREKRTRPGLDDKILTDWNGLMITALIRTGVIFKRPDWIEIAAKAYRFIAESMLVGERLHHSARDGVLQPVGFASDYAAFALAGLALNEATGASDALENTQRISRFVLDTYQDATSGVLAMTEEDAGGLIMRPVTTHDDAVPNANGMMIEALWRLRAATGDQQWGEEADTLLSTNLAAAVHAPLAHGTVLNALDFRLRSATIVVQDTTASGLYQAALELPFWSRIVTHLMPDGLLAPEATSSGETVKAGEPSAHICIGQTCSLPVSTAADLFATYQAAQVQTKTAG